MVEAAETPVIHMGTALQRQRLEFLQGHCRGERKGGTGGPSRAHHKRENAELCSSPPYPAPLTEVVQALVIDGTVTGIDSLYRYRLEVQELERGVPMPT